jgi:riboflavin kinase / FMN adenylyltransferase
MGTNRNHITSEAIEVIDDWRDFPARLRGGCVTIGNFDGVHLGHQVLLGQVADWGAQRNRPSIVFTFSPHPLAVLQPEHAPPPLTTLAERARRLARCGIDTMVVCRVDQALLDWDYRYFFEQVIVKILAARRVVEGPNFFFGKDRHGDVARLQELCLIHRIESQIVVPEEIEGRMISSSRIRHWLRAGEVSQANAALGSPFRITGEVVPGDRRGRVLGFPTANLANILTLLPKEGVYAAWTRIGNRRFPVALNIGAPLTFNNGSSRVEAHVLGLSSDLYGQTLSFDLGQRLREVRRFESVDELRHQIQVDVATVKTWALAGGF